MALFPIHQYFYRNGKLKPCSEFVASENEGGVYEVLRVVDGVPLFVEDHLQRFYCSAEIAGKTLHFSAGELLKMLNGLIEKNGVTEGNILISCKVNLKAFFIAHSYPGVDDYMHGVSCGLLHAERHNPNAKVFQTQVRTVANQLIAEHDYYEVLLVDHNGNITEGSRSNVFVIRHEKILTPFASKVLVGITRQKTMECARNLNIGIEEKELPLSGLHENDAVFLTGTSPKILPVNRIEDVEFDVKSLLLRQLMREYDRMIEDYVAEEKKRPFSS